MDRWIDVHVIQYAIASIHYLYISECIASIHVSIHYPYPYPYISKHYLYIIRTLSIRYAMLYAIVSYRVL
jgi:hypothetical protein